MILGLGGNATHVDSYAADDEEPWRINFIPYIWVPESTARLEVNGTPGDVHERPNREDLTFNPNVLGFGYGAVRNGWGVVLEGETLDAEFSFDSPDGRPGELALDGQRVGIAGVREWKRDLYSGSRLYITPWIGLRYRHLSLKLVDPEFPVAGDDAGMPADTKVETLDSEDSDWVSPLAGLRIQWFVTPKVSLSLAGNVDGLSRDQMSWTATSWLKVHMSRAMKLGIGYRYTDSDFTDGTLGRGWGVDDVSQGIAVALELDFLAQTSPSSTSLSDITMAPRMRDAFMWTPSSADMDSGLSPTGRVGRLLDRGHALVNDVLDAGVEYVDTGMVKSDEPALRREYAEFELELYGRLTDRADGGTQFEFRPGGRLSFDLPNLERGLKLLVSDRAVDEVPGTDPFERESGLNVGLERPGLFLKKTKLRLGVRSSLDAYASASYAPEVRYRRWRLVPEARAYYRTDVGAGTIGSLLAVYRIKDRYRASQRASIEYGDKTDGDLQWLGKLSFSYLFEGDEKDYHRAIFTQFSARGTVEDGSTAYEWSPFRYRAPLYKKWLYWEIGPEIVWRRDDLWEPEPTLRFGLSSLFWGTPDR